MIAETQAGGGLRMRPVDYGLVPLELTRMTGLGPRAGLGERELRIPAEAFERALEAVTAGLVPEDPELDANDAATLADLLAHRRSSWRIRSSWRDAGGPQGVAFAVLDGAERGYWLTHHAGEGEDRTVVLEPVKPSVVWSKLMDLLP